jgi:hypothetical protein
MSDRRELTVKLRVCAHGTAERRLGAQSDGWHGPPLGRGVRAHPPAAAEPSEVSG